MSKLNVYANKCKGCGYCALNCTKQAIAITGPINEKGYSTPVVDREKCIVCGICFNVCPDYVYEITEEG